MVTRASAMIQRVIVIAAMMVTTVERVNAVVWTVLMALCSGRSLQTALYMENLMNICHVRDDNLHCLHQAIGIVTSNNCHCWRACVTVYKTMLLRCQTHSAIRETTARIKLQDRSCYSGDPDEILTRRAMLLHLTR